MSLDDSNTIESTNNTIKYLLNCYHLKQRFWNILGYVKACEKVYDKKKANIKFEIVCYFWNIW